jgi:amino-acid N-acetyltransferase
MNDDTTDGAIRHARFGDAKAIFGIIRDHPDELVPRPMGDILQNIDRFLVAEVGGAVAGCVSWGILPEPGSVRHPSVEIKTLAVDPAFRGRRLGQALVKRVIEEIRPFRPEQIIVLTFAPDFFRRFGFVETPKEQLMHKIYSGCANCTRYESPFTCPEIAMSLNLED